MRFGKKIFSFYAEIAHVGDVEVVKTSGGVARRCLEWRSHGVTIGLVPTMGALHAGHMELIKRARRQCQQVVVSIYVNPSQFGPTEDLNRYPKPRRADLALCRAAGVNLVFAPNSLYLPDHSTWVMEEAESAGQEGAQRPGHFRGVATVVLMLFNMVQPHFAYFGQKDAQQVRVVQRMVRDLHVPVRLVVVPIARDEDGLALSSRNRYLSPEERVTAGKFAQLLRQAAESGSPSPEKWLIEKLAEVPGLTLDYCEKTGDRLVVAVRVGKTRLLDNYIIT